MTGLGSTPIVVGESAQLGVPPLTYAEVGVRLPPPAPLASPALVPATLVVDLLGQLQALETRVAALEAQTLPARWSRVLAWLQARWQQLLERF